MPCGFLPVVITKTKRRAGKKITALRITMWSPTIVINDPDDSYLFRSEVNQCCDHGIVIPESTATFFHIKFSMRQE